MGFTRQGYWSRLPCPPPGDLPNQESNLGLQHCRQTLFHLSHQGSPMRLHIPHTLLQMLFGSFGYFFLLCAISHSTWAQAPLSCCYFYLLSPLGTGLNLVTSCFCCHPIYSWDLDSGTFPLPHSLWLPIKATSQNDHDSVSTPGA